MTERRPSIAHLGGQARRIAPGLLLALVIGLAAGFLSDHYGTPVMLLALLLGLAFHFLWEEGPCAAGVDFAATTLLRLGVGLLGIRITFAQIAEIGLGPLLLVLICVPATILCGLIVARLTGRDWTFGMVAGGAVAICGASAALAIAAVLPRRPESEQNTLFTVIAVTGLSTLAMILYPILFSAVGFGDHEIGIMLGATVHDVAQVVGAGYAVSDEAGDIATFVKLVRVALLPVVILVLIFTTRGSGQGSRAGLPWFVVLFAALALIGNLGVVPPALAQGLSELSRWLLVIAISALGVKTSLKQMFSVGVGHFAVVVVTTGFLVVLAITLSTVL